MFSGKTFKKKRKLEKKYIFRKSITITLSATNIPKMIWSRTTDDRTEQILFATNLEGHQQLWASNNKATVWMENHSEWKCIDTTNLTQSPPSFLLWRQPISVQHYMTQKSQLKGKITHQQRNWPAAQKHFLWTMDGPDSSYSPFEIHIWYNKTQGLVPFVNSKL